MRYRIFKIIVTIFSELAGLACVVVAFFAFQLGLDNNFTLGTMRKILAGFGVLLLLAPLLLFALKRVSSHFRFSISFHKLAQKWVSLNQRFAGMEKPLSPIRTFFNSKPIFWSTLGVLIVMVCSLWYITSGLMIYFHGYSNYYDMQADGFLAGRTSLLIEPAKELLNLANPYDWHARVGIPAIWDASLYQGKYYLYWGPVPALLATLVKLIKPGVVQDQYLLLFFLCGFVISFASLLVYLQKIFFPSVPAWTLMVFITLTGLSTPLFWLTNRPNVYETAIASCQFFLFLGLYALVRGLSGSTNQWKWMVLAGTSLGAAVGSRMTIVLTVFLIVGVCVFELVRKQSSNKIGSTMALLIPLILFACGLAWFNYARFGSLFETGMRYQLTGEALPDDLSQLFALRYVIPNTYLSLLQPFQFTPRSFPFFIATIDNSWTKIIHMPENYYFAEQVTGILCTIPFLWFLVIPAIQLIQKGWHWVKEAPAPARSTSGEPTPKWLWALVIGSSLISFMTNMMFVMTTMRYLADFTPLLLLLTCLIVMREVEHTRSSKLTRGVLLTALIVFGMITVTIGLFINFMSGDRRMLNDNPALYARLEQFFNR